MKIDEKFTHNDPARGYAMSAIGKNTPIIFPYRTLGEAIVFARAHGSVKGKPITIYGDWSYWRGPVAKVNYHGKVRYL